MFGRLFARRFVVAAPLAASAIISRPLDNARMMPRTEDASEDSDDAYDAENGGCGKPCNTPGFWHLGCQRACFGREEKITCDPKVGGVTPNAQFNCPGCEFIFHGNCLDMTRGEIKRLTLAAKKKEAIAACACCTTLLHGVWRHAAKDTATVFHAVMSAVVLDRDTKKLKEQIAKIADAASMDVDEGKEWYG